MNRKPFSIQFSQELSFIKLRHWDFEVYHIQTRRAHYIVIMWTRGLSHFPHCKMTHKGVNVLPVCHTGSETGAQLAAQGLEDGNFPWWDPPHGINSLPAVWTSVAWSLLQALDPLITMWWFNIILYSSYLWAWHMPEIRGDKVNKIMAEMDI